MKQIKSKKNWLIIASVAVLLSIGAYFILGVKVNYAEKTAKPLEQAILDAGATKVCSSGDDGRGVDSRAPDYGVVFKTDLSKDKAIELIKSVASNNGYKLTQADSSYEYISAFFDHTSVSSSYPDLQTGPVLLGISVYSGGSNLSCSGSDLKYDSEHAAIKMNVALPSFK